jgi:methylmalonyl-CoA/ethylmalonyl-CoA epimerase
MGPRGWSWPCELDALIAAPDSHRLLFENDRVRVLEVVIESGAREPEHTHRWPSVMIVDRPARIRYFDRGIQTFESPAGDRPHPKTSWMDAEGPHSVENIDSVPYHALRIELQEVAWPGPGELRVVLTVDDYEQAVRFYGEAIGLTQLADWSGEQGKVMLLDGGHATLELIDPRQAAWIDRVEVGRRVAPPVRLAFRVQDSVALADDLDAAGAERLGDVVDTPWGDRNVRLRAPDGMQLTLFSTL